MSVVLPCVASRTKRSHRPGGAPRLWGDVRHSICHRAFRAWLTGRWSPNSRGSLWETARHPAVARWIKDHCKTHVLSGTISHYGFALRTRVRPLEGWIRPRGHGLKLMIGDPVAEAPITWTIRISNGAYDASGHVAAVDDDPRFKSPYKYQNFPQKFGEKKFSCPTLLG